jgi:hypothetical protein
MSILMLDPSFKSMQLVTMYWGQENVVVFYTKYDEELVLLLLIEVAKLLMLISGVEIKDQVNFEDPFLNTTTNAYTYKDLVAQELIGYHILVSY